MGSLRAELPLPRPRSRHRVLACSTLPPSPPLLGRAGRSGDGAGSGRRGDVSASPPVSGGGGGGDSRGGLPRWSPVASLDAGIQADACLRLDMQYLERRRTKDPIKNRTSDWEEHLDPVPKTFKIIRKNHLKICTQLFFKIAENKEDYHKLYEAFSKNLKRQNSQTTKMEYLEMRRSKDPIKNRTSDWEEHLDVKHFSKNLKLQNSTIAENKEDYHKLYEAFSKNLKLQNSQTTNIKAFAQLPVLLDEQFSKDNNCEDCGSPHNIDLLLSNTPHFFTIVFNWLDSSESQETLSEVLAGITSPVDTGFFRKITDSSTMYTVTAMICCADESYVCFALDDEDKSLIYGFETVEICCADESYVCFGCDDEDKWLIYGFKTVETEDTWEHLLPRFKDYSLAGARTDCPQSLRI